MTRRATVVAAAFAATALYFHRAVFSADVFVVRDIFRVYYPLKQYWAQRIASGEFPAWFPGDGLGQPYVGMLISGAFHPLNVLYLVFPLGVALKLNLLVCYPAAVLGAFALARRLGCDRGPALLAGVAYGFCGFLTGLTNNLLYLEAAATVPWVLAAADWLVEAPSPARALATAALLALVGFSGDGQTLVVTGALVLLLAALRGRSARAVAVAAAAGGLGALLCAVQLLPAAATLPESGTRNLDDAMTLTWSMHPLLLLELVFGPIFGGDPAAATSVAVARDVLDTHQTSLWVESMHLGLGVVVLAAIGAVALRRDRRFWVAAGAACALLLLLLGKRGGLYPLMLEAVPFWKAFRYPMKLAPPFLLALSLAAAWGLEAIDGSLRLRRAAQVTLAVAAGLGVLAWLAPGALVAPWFGAPPGLGDRLTANAVSSMLQTAFAALALLAAVTFVDRAGPRALAAAAIAGVHLFAANEPMVLLSDPEVLETAPPFVDVIRARAPKRVEPVRVTDVLDVLPVPEIPGHPYVNRLAAAMSRSMAADSQRLWGFDTSNAYLPATSSRYRGLVLDKRLWLPRYSPLLSTQFIVIPEPTFTGIGGSRDVVISEDATFQLLLLQNARALPRAYLAQPRCVVDRAAAEAAIARHAVPPRVAIVECGRDAPAPEAPPMGTAAITAYAPERVEVAVDAASAGVLVLNDAHYRGWSAELDGAPVEIRPANVAVRSIDVPAGRHTAVFTYRAPGLALGAWISALSALGAGALALQRKSRREKTMTASARNPAV